MGCGVEGCQCCGLFTLHGSIVRRMIEIICKWQFVSFCFLDSELSQRQKRGRSKGSRQALLHPGPGRFRCRPFPDSKCPL